MKTFHSICLLSSSSRTPSQTPSETPRMKSDRWSVTEKFWFFQTDIWRRDDRIDFLLPKEICLEFRVQRLLLLLLLQVHMHVEQAVRPNRGETSAHAHARPHTPSSTQHNLCVLSEGCQLKLKCTKEKNKKINNAAIVALQGEEKVVSSISNLKWALINPRITGIGSSNPN